ncbi:hypothetical protein E4T56_gene18504 [Termitomyces sp. T112]|nr:hypothetical protein E4T56_gene18504 [Termitomyces sp. T112]
MSPSTEVLFQQLYDTKNSVLVSALRGDLSDLQSRVKQLKSLWKQISQAKDKRLVLEARKSFSIKALQILSGKLSDAKTIEELKEKAGAYFKESQARKEVQEVNKGQAAGRVAAIDPPMVAADLVIPVGLVSTSAPPSSVGPSPKPGRVLVSSLLSPVEPVPAQPWLIKKASKAQIPQQEWRKYTAQTLPHSPPPPNQSKYQSVTLDEDNENDSNDNNSYSDDEECWQGEITPSMSLTPLANTVKRRGSNVNPITITTDSSISSRSATTSVDSTGPAASITDSAIATDSVISTRPTAIITDSAIATRLAASNESTVPTGVETVLASPIAATRHLMDVDMTGPAPPHPPDEIVPQHGHSMS